MKKTIYFGAATMAAVALSGCGHSFGGGAKGIGLRCAWQPDTIMPELQFGYYEAGFACVREHAEYTYEGSGTGGVTGTVAVGALSGETGIKIGLKTGDQLNGYAVDVAKEKQGL